MAQTPGEIELWLEYFDEIKVFDSQKCTAAQKFATYYGCKKGRQGSSMDCIEDGAVP
jgi:hypothetical protein